MNAEVVLEAVGLQAGYGERAVVSGLDLTVHLGEVVALLGPNGAGKTTTLLSLAGAIPTIGGDVLIVGQRTRAPLHRRVRMGLGYVADDRSVFKSLSVKENLRAARVDPEACFELFPELRRLLRVKAGDLSGGEQQMLTIGRALARHPRVLLVDELSTGLGPLVVQRLMRALGEAADRQQMGVLVVEQFVSEVLAIADRAYVISRGRLEFAGSADELSKNPAALQAAYLGSTADARSVPPLASPPSSTLE